MDKEDFLSRRFQDLAEAADRKGTITFTDFLNLSEQNIYDQTLQKFPCIHGETFGGYEGAERLIAAFIPEEILWMPEEKSNQILSPSKIPFPICCIHISPRSLKFSDNFNHRDVLGALMNLGIDRGKVGDILVSDHEADLFCDFELSDLICRELLKVRHCQVECKLSEEVGFTYSPATKCVQGSIASVRLDSLIALGFGVSRSSLAGMISGGKVFVNGRKIFSGAYTPKEGDLISVRGLGKMKYDGCQGKTKKGRMIATVERYI